MADYSLNRVGMVIRASDGATIPVDPLNADYQAYEVWTAAGNKADPYVAPPAPAPLTPAQKLAKLGLTVDDLKALLAS